MGFINYCCCRGEREERAFRRIPPPCPKPQCHLLDPSPILYVPPFGVLLLLCSCPPLGTAVLAVPVPPSTHFPGTQRQNPAQNQAVLTQQGCLCLISLSLVHLWGGRCGIEVSGLRAPSPPRHAAFPSSVPPAALLFHLLHLTGPGCCTAPPEHAIPSWKPFFK